MAPLTLLLLALLQSVPSSQPALDLGPVVERLAGAAGAGRAEAEAELGTRLHPGQVPALLLLLDPAPPEARARAQRVLAARADLLPALFDALPAAVDPARREFLESALDAHFHLHRAAVPEDLGTVAALPSSLFSFHAAGLSHLEICERLNRSGRLELPILVAPELAQQGTWIHELSTLPDGAVGTVADLLATGGFSIALPGGLPRRSPGVLWLRLDHVLAASAQFPAPDDGALFVALLRGVRSGDPITRDVAILDLGCLALDSLDGLFRHLAAGADPQGQRAGDLGLAVRVARGRSELAQGVDLLLRFCERGATPGEPRPLWFRHAARRGAERLPADQLERLVAWIRAALADPAPARRAMALSVAGACARAVRDPLLALAQGNDPADAVAALAACAGLPASELAAAVEPLVRRLAVAPLPDAWPAALAELLVGRVAPPALQNALPDLRALPAGPASQAAALLLAASGRDGARRVAEAVLAAAAEEPRLPAWIEGLRLARQHGAMPSNDSFLAAFLREPRERKAAAAAAFTLLADAATEEQREGRLKFAGDMAQVLSEELARRGAFAARAFWARAFGRFLGLMGIAPGGRRIAEVLVDQIMAGDEEDAMLAAFAAEACIEVRRGVVLDLAAALRPRRANIPPRVAQFLELRVLRQGPLPALDLPDPLRER